MASKPVCIITVQCSVIGEATDVLFLNFTRKRATMFRFLALCILSSVCATFLITAERPNIVLIMCDDLGYGDLGCFGNDKNLSPHLDKLAKEGLKLTSFYSASPVCSPSRAGFMTGRTPNRLGIYDWIPHNSGVFMRGGEITIAQLLKKAGYNTCHVGKWHLNSKVDNTEPTPGDAGFDHFFYTQNNAAPHHMQINNFIRNGEKTEPTEGPSSHVVVAEALRWLESKDQSQPFYLNVWFHETHEPVASSDEFLARYPDEKNNDLQHYRGNVTQMDAAVGKLLAYLDEKKLREKTLVIFTSDNGPETLNRYKTANRSYGTPGPLRGMKLHVTEAGYRVPGIVSWPGRVAAAVSDVPASSLDFLPTMCALAGVAAPNDRALEGTNIAPLFFGKAIERTQPLYWQYDRAISPPWQVAIRDGSWKLLANATLDKFALYNLDDDIAEQKDRSGEQPERLQQMIATMKKIHASVAEDGIKSGNPIKKKK